MEYTYWYTSSASGGSEPVGQEGLQKGHGTTSTIDPATRVEQIKEERRLLEAEQQIQLEKALGSDDPRVLIKAQAFLDEILNDEARAQEGVTVLTDPYLSQYAHMGYKTKRAQLNSMFLRKMASTTIIRSIITTRQAQIENFAAPRKGRYDTGFIIEKMSDDYYTDEEVKLSSLDKKEIRRLTKFLLDGGEKKEGETNWMGETFNVFLRKIVEDSLSLDAATAEIVYNRGGAPSRYFAIDAGTIYLAHVDSDGNYEARTGTTPKEVNGYMPSHVQLIEQKIVADYYPWEIMYGIRNARSDIYQNGYGRSELEDLVNIITWQLNTDQYNGNFFTQGSNPKGMLLVPKGLNRNRISELRQEWRSMVVGTKNAHKIPVIEGDGVQWLDMHKTNADMQFNEWQEYLIKVICALYKIAPEEIGFNFDAQGGGLNSETESETRIKFSRDKGLFPLMKAIESWINKWIIWQLNPQFRFRFVGLDIESESEELDRDIKAAGTFMGLKEVRRKRGLPDKIDEDDMILNQVWLSKQQGDAMASMQEESGAVAQSWDSLGVEEDDFEKSLETTLITHKDNPMLQDALTLFRKLATDGGE